MWLITYVFDGDLHGSVCFLSESEAVAEFDSLKEDTRYQLLRLFEQKAVCDRR